MLELTDQDGISLRDALVAFGCDPEAIAGEAMRREDVLGYLEVHIEQGPVLEKEGEALGVVSAIASQGRYRLRGVGKAGHAGTVPMALRQDALTAAAEVVLTVDRIARAGSEASLVATVGDLRVQPGASNVIPGMAEWTLDVRAGTDEARIKAASAIRVRSGEIGLERGVVVEMETVHEKPVVLMAPRFKGAIAKAIQEVTGVVPREIMSGAGHDGQALTHLADIGMIFVRCRGGISHNPEEHVSIEDLGMAVEALVQTVIELGREEEGQ
jgi:hydantoinase/carbamoylase family amidase